MIDKALLEELRARFSDLLNYDSEDPLEPINPLTYRTPEGDTCLHLAATRGDRRSVELLLDAGLDINQKGDMGNTVLHYAKRHGHEDIAKILIERGADPDIKNEFGEK